MYLIPCIYMYHKFVQMFTIFEDTVLRWQDQKLISISCNVRSVTIGYLAYDEQYYAPLLILYRVILARNIAAPLPEPRQQLICSSRGFLPCSSATRQPCPRISQLESLRRCKLIVRAIAPHFRFSCGFY
jgi:hypothetical protein